MRKAGWTLGILTGALLLVCAPALAQQNSNQCPQVAAEVDFITKNAQGTALGALFSMNQDGADGDPPGPTPPVVVPPDGIPDVIHLAPVEFLIRSGSQFYSASACATYQANYAAAFSAVQAAGLVGLLGGGDEVVAALSCIDKDQWIPLVSAVVAENGFSLPLNTANFTNIPNLKANEDKDGDGQTLLQEWQSLNPTYSSGQWTTTAGTGNTIAYAAFASEVLSGSNVVVTVSATPGTTIFPTQTTQINASSNANPPDTSFNYSSSDTSVATVNSSGLVTGVAVGTAVITVQAQPSGAQATITITVAQPDWFDLCNIDDAFAIQGAGFAAAAGPLLSLPADINQWDIEGLVGDGVLDAWQLYHLAYILCTGGLGNKDVDKAQVVVEFQGNTSSVNSFLNTLDNLPPKIDALSPQLVTAGTAILTWRTAVINSSNPAELTLLGTLVTAAAGATTEAQLFGTAGGGNVWLANGQTIAGTGQALPPALGSGSTFDTIAGFLPNTNTFLTGLWGLSTEMKATLNGMLQSAGLIGPGNTAQGVVNQLQQLPVAVGGYAQILDVVMQAHAGAFGPPFTGAFVGTAGVAATVGADLASTATFLNTPGNVPAPFATPNPTVYGTTSKLVNEPFSGAGDGNPNDDIDSNGDVAAAVIGAGGDQDDYLAGVTGEFGPFWTGNPFLPVGGVLGLSALCAALGLGSATLLRRKR